MRSGRQQLGKQLWLQIDVGQVVVIVPQVAEVDFFVGGLSELVERLVATIKLSLCDVQHWLRVAEYVAKPLPGYWVNKAHVF